MTRIDLFKKHLEEKRAVKVIAGIDNFDVESVRKVVSAAENTGASAVDICADENIVKMVREMTDSVHMGPHVLGPIEYFLF